MIRRTLQEQLERAAERYPVVTMTGPRQSGKTTLARTAFPDRPYVSLETPSEREFAAEDPLGFLARFEQGGILDEIQRAPELLSYMQGMVDEDPSPGRFVLTGSQNLPLIEGVSQSLAGRTALLELLNLASLAADCGVSQPTARRWLSTLEASFIVFRLPPFHANLGKRLVKRPKLYFYDPGLAASLLGIDAPEQLAAHPLRGAMFEGWLVSEVVKWHRHRGRRPQISFFGERDRLEIDLVVERGAELTLIEAKAGRTPSSEHFAAFGAFAERIAARGDGRWRVARRMVVYGGEESQTRSQGELVSWTDLPIVRFDDR